MKGIPCPVCHGVSFGGQRLFIRGETPPTLCQWIPRAL
ncbi:hypothetical protein D187_009071 [Cystobacter fuscus DSM 2262]|uniref:Uncharacterized protein n=1 Tax=Cystobacter fuscus (strain ATCC 25194 / DSM 2262 / NBRC 100088 / M29) TaxID=1242864 RepID=S9NTI9_CYSF2|nr:hypothetical protein D187_009071 [Cystobacter fuscus DSM 2262]